LVRLVALPSQTTTFSAAPISKHPILNETCLLLQFSRLLTRKRRVNIRRADGQLTPNSASPQVLISRYHEHIDQHGSAAHRSRIWITKAGHRCASCARHGTRGIQLSWARYHIHGTTYSAYTCSRSLPHAGAVRICHSLNG
jgi:hypothetical protein